MSEQIQNTKRIRAYSLITPAKLSKNINGRPLFYGYLRKGDPVYVWGNSGGKYVFSVIKWGKCGNKGLVRFSLPVSSFTSNLNFSGVDGTDDKKVPNNKKKMIITGAVAVAGGLLVSTIAKRLGKNGMLYGAVGVIASGIITWVVLKKGMEE